MSVAGLILAAGRSTRFGGDKRLARLPDGRTLLEAALARHVSRVQPLLIVLHRGDEQLADLATEHGAHVLIAHDAHLGIGHSLACGARALLGMPHVSGVVIDLADMPMVEPQTIQRVRQSLIETGRAVVPLYNGRPGHPRGLPRTCFSALTQLSGDQGARHLLDWRQAVQLDVVDPGVLLDVDRPTDLAGLSAALNRA